MNKNLKIAIIMLIVFFPMILFSLLIGAAVMIIFPIIILAGIISVLLCEGLVRIFKNRDTEGQTEEDLHTERKTAWFWVNTTLVVMGAILNFDWFAWSAFMTMPYLSSEFLETCKAFRNKEVRFKDLWMAYTKDDGNYLLTGSIYLKLFLGSQLLVMGARGIFSEQLFSIFGTAAIVVFLLIGGALLRSFYTDVMKFSVEMIPAEEVEG